ncbi:MAG: pyrimidine 5'-nucleotidase [Candidatus Aureabacteria bacterium]|nr:pyrimidine 5'-nucleotidase [Candidatus Auribacterota bacterium]
MKNKNTVLLFDLDHTLYPRETGILQRIDRNICDFLAGYFKISAEEAEELRRGFYRQYGLSLTGLIKEYPRFDVKGYLKHVYDFDIEKMLKPAEKLKRILLSIPNPKYIFTNGLESYASRILKALNVSKCFRKIYGIEFMNFNCKPSAEAFLKVAEDIGRETGDFIMIDDLPQNLLTAKNLNMKTILVGKEQKETYIDETIKDIMEIPGALQRLGGQRKKRQQS